LLGTTEEQEFRLRVLLVDAREGMRRLASRRRLTTRRI
jgi:hypothetical protein